MNVKPVNKSKYVPLFAELCSEFPELVFWKHFESGIIGNGDIDTIAPFELVGPISERLAGSLIDIDSDVMGIMECHASPNVRPHFIVLKSEYPSLFQFDISWKPRRMGTDWCDPKYLPKYSVINENGIRILTPGALSIVLLILYGLTRRGENCMRPTDHKDLLVGIRKDRATAELFVEEVCPPFVRDELHELISALQYSDWAKERIARMWKIFAINGLKQMIWPNPFNWIRLVPELKVRFGQHHHSRTASLVNADSYLAKMAHSQHVVRKSSLRN